MNLWQGKHKPVLTPRDLMYPIALNPSYGMTIACVRQIMWLYLQKNERDIKTEFDLHSKNATTHCAYPSKLHVFFTYNLN